jgi:hypothetical protein
MKCTTQYMLWYGVDLPARDYEDGTRLETE